MNIISKFCAAMLMSIALLYVSSCKKDTPDGGGSPSPSGILISTNDVDSITGTTAISGGIIARDGGSEIIRKGVCWDIEDKPDTTFQTDDGTGMDDYTSYISGLMPNTTYYIRAYALNSRGLAYGPVKSFTTLEPDSNTLIISTNTVSNITANSATCGGIISADGGSPITQRGVCWGTSQNPTTTNNTTNDGSGSGSFTSSLTNLTANTTYYVRAYASNANGTTYGNELSFTSTSAIEGNGIIAFLQCDIAQITGTLSNGTVASNVSISVPYAGGNGGVHNEQSVYSTGVTGLIATLAAGSFANGNGILMYNISGVASSTGTANFELNIGGQSCSTSIPVNIAGTTGSSATGCGAQNIVNPSLTYGSVTDIDGNNYKTIVIGTQEWTAENLRTTRFNNGSMIQNLTDGLQWKETTAPAWCNYSNNSSYDCPYGKIYNWYAASNSQEICPIGWHVPTREDVIILMHHLDPSIDIINGPFGSDIVGEKNRSSNQMWQGSTAPGTNESGLSMLPSGGRHPEMLDVSTNTFLYGKFENINQSTSFWTSSSNINSFGTNLNIGNFGSHTHGRKFGKPIRCVKD